MVWSGDWSGWPEQGVYCEAVVALSAGGCKWWRVVGVVVEVVVVGSRPGGWPVWHWPGSRGRSGGERVVVVGSGLPELGPGRPGVGRDTGQEKSGSC